MVERFSILTDFHTIVELKTNPENIGKIIKDISISFYLQEKCIHVAKYILQYNLSDAFFAKVLCMLKLKLVHNKLFSQLNVLFDLSSSLFSDIVFFTDVNGKPKHQFMRNISTLYLLCDIFADITSVND
jgi:hypothetical protein